MNKSLSRLILLVAILASPAQLFANVEAEERNWRFKVLLGDKEIGEHRFNVTEQDDRQTVTISADFDVKILFVNAYSYDHRNTEHWIEGCMHRIESETDDNGDLARVTGTRTADGFTVRTMQAAPFTLEEDCVHSFAYWNPGILTSGNLLNSQTGEWVDVDIERLAIEPFEVDGIRYTAEKYQILMEEGPITLWYEKGTGLWLALEAVTRNGRTLRYQPIQLPEGNDSDSLLVAR